MAKAELNVAQRDGSGKGVARQLRREGRIPAVVYGKEMETSLISVDSKELTNAISNPAGWNTLLTLRGASAVEGKVVILKDLDVHAIRRDPQHADFHAINVKDKIHVMVPVHAVGTAAGQKIGGSLQVIRHELEIACLPTDIPEAIEIDVTEMNIGDVVHVEDLKLPAGVEAPHEVNFTVVTLTGRKPEEEETEAGEEEAATEE